MFLILRSVVLLFISLPSGLFATEEKKAPPPQLLLQPSGELQTPQIKLEGVPTQVRRLVRGFLKPGGEELAKLGACNWSMRQGAIQDSKRQFKKLAFGKEADKELRPLDKRIYEACLTEGPEVFPDVKDLTVDLNKASARFLSQVPDKFPNLTSLDLISQKFDAAMLAILPKLPSLRTLGLEGEFDANDPEQTSNLYKLGELTELGLSSLSTTSMSSFLQALATHLPKLQKLDLASEDTVAVAEGGEAKTISFPALTGLGARRLPSSLLARLDLPNLEKYMLGDDFSEEHCDLLTRFPTRFPKLRELRAYPETAFLAESSFFSSVIPAEQL